MEGMNPLLRSLLRFLFSAVGLLAASGLVPGITHGPFLHLVLVAVILGFLNTTLGSFLKAVAVLPMACSLGCFSLVINGLVFWLAGALAPSLGLVFHVSGFWAGFLGALISSVVASVLEMIFIGRSRTPPPGPGPEASDRPRPLKIIN